jgi:DNA-binding transcriptional MerR regulator
MNAAEAARRLGVSAKALRLYEQRGLLAPVRSAAGWRAYGPDEMNRAGEIAALRALGFSLAQVARVLQGDPQGLEPALAAHQAALEGRLHQLAGTIERVHGLRDGLARGRAPTAGELARLLGPEVGIAFDLPWPWGGERFELGPVRPLTYIVGPLGSGKTRLALRLAEVLPGAAFLGLDRAALDGAAAGALLGARPLPDWDLSEKAVAAAKARLDADPDLRARVDRALAWLVEDGATVSDALVALLAGLEAEGPVVVDMVEQGLDQATQEALIAHLRRRGPAGPGAPEGRPLFLMTRSCAILYLAAVGPDEAILLCPANHSPPVYVAPYPGAPGYEAVATCLATPEVRERLSRGPATS